MRKESEELPLSDVFVLKNVGDIASFYEVIGLSKFKQGNRVFFAYFLRHKVAIGFS